MAPLNNLGSIEDKTHVTLRLAWHAHGWNGVACTRPHENTYCVGPHSYPGEMIAERRNIVEQENGCSQCSSAFKGTPACIYSINAFGKTPLSAWSPPPAFFNDQTETRYWELPPATVCAWPYEEMYTEEVQREDETYDYDKRLKRAEVFFGSLVPGKSLIFYYCNYSNPFSEDDVKRYVLVGISRLKEIGPTIYYENTSEKVRSKYAGGFVWQRNVTSMYPDEGLRLPYIHYMDRPDILNRIVLSPDDPQTCKFAARRVSDDDALVMVERFLESVAVLQELGDSTEDWADRKSVV